MNQTGPVLNLPMDCEQAVAQIVSVLIKSGLQVTRSFDLQVARSAHNACTCPHHGTSQCDCQMVVLLVYGSETNPLTLVAHGRDGQTQVSLVHTPEVRPNAKLEALIRQRIAASQSPSHEFFRHIT